MQPIKLKVFSFGKTVEREFLRGGTYLGEGGFTEVCLCFAILCYAIMFAFQPYTIWQTVAIRSLADDHTPNIIVSIPFWLGGLPSAVGLIAGWINHSNWSKYLRIIGSSVQLLVWSWFTIKTQIMVVGGASLPWYCIGAIGSFRIILLIIKQELE